MVIGIDEVGRGAWAGPLVVGAVGLDKKIHGLKDSKLLSKQERIILAKKIREEAVYVGLGWVSSVEIDQHGLAKGLRIGSRRALEPLGLKYESIVIDGNVNLLPEDSKAYTQIKADLVVPEVSAASIIAKVARDEFMETVSRKYPVYGFEKNVGYGTNKHRDSLRQFGICSIHRRSYKPIKVTLKES